MKKKVGLRNRKTTADYILAGVAILIGVITVYPMWYVICMSISDPGPVIRGEVTFFPIGFCLDAYQTIFKDTQLFRSLLNSVLYVLFALAMMLTSCIMMAYPLTRPNLKGRKFVVFFLLIPMYFGGSMIPTYLIYTKVLHLYDTFWAVAIPHGFSIMNIILCRSFLAGIPSDLTEAARIDGAGNTQVLLKIIIPLAMPVLAVISIYTIVAVWNSWFSSMLYQANTDLHPVQMYLQRLLIQQKVNINDLVEQGASASVIADAVRASQVANQLKYAMITVVTLPILMVYPMFQKHFVKGVMLGSLKG